MKEANSKRLGQVAAQWNLKPRELEAFVEMINSSPWKLVGEIFTELEKAGQRDLEQANGTFELARAQGTVTTIKKIKNRISNYVEIYKEATDEDR